MVNSKVHSSIRRIEASVLVIDNVAVHRCRSL